ncbi:hypothetical protein CP533_6494 [Ophiocordyceps camponoti-saundersi (nom. inval.)]|nr:hypothetical protein CP533_6494 [Ophiocordyceps camponoti-saundersi (nom. inval.)]
MGRRCFSFGAGPWDPDRRFETSCLVRPWTLFLCRAAMCIYAFVTIFFIIIFDCTAITSPPPSSPSHKTATTAATTAKDTTTGCASVPRSFSYFTVLSYWGLAFYFLFASLHSFSYARTGHPLLLRFPRPLQALHSLFYSSIVVFPFIVTLTYWAVLYRASFPTAFDTWRNVSQHALNSVFALFEIVVPRTSPLPWLHLAWLALFLLAYLAVAFITLADQGFYVYAFLDYRQAGGRAYVAAYVFGITFALVLIFCAVHFLIRLRCWLTESKLKLAVKYARDPSLAADIEAAVVETKASS